MTKPTRTPRIRLSPAARLADAGDAIACDLEALTLGMADVAARAERLEAYWHRQMLGHKVTIREVADKRRAQRNAQRKG